MYFDVPFTVEVDDEVLFRRFAAYVTKIATYARIDYLRENKKYEAGLELMTLERKGSYEDPPPIERGTFAFESERLSDAFDSLPPLRRQILAMAFIEDMPSQEIAERLGRSVDYVYKQKHLAIQALRDKLLKG